MPAGPGGRRGLRGLRSASIYVLLGDGPPAGGLELLKQQLLQGAFQPFELLHGFFSLGFPGFLKVSPSGKLTDTWAKRYADLPFAQDYSYLNGDLENEFYKEGIYVGYRFFDSFGVSKDSSTVWAAPGSSAAVFAKAAKD